MVLAGVRRAIFKVIALDHEVDKRVRDAGDAGRYLHNVEGLSAALADEVKSEGFDRSLGPQNSSTKIGRALQHLSPSPFRHLDSARLKCGYHRFHAPF